ncbi:MAG: hypothetical protein ACM3H9_02565 [Rhodospirillaceae bacterium]
MQKPVYIAAYHQSEFGKLTGMTVPGIIKVPAAPQVKHATAAAAFNIGGPICASVCTVLKPGA